MTKLFTKLNGGNGGSGPPTHGCDYIPTLYAWELTDDAPEIDDYINLFIRDKFVFIGYNIDGVNSHVISPVHGRIPAAEYHAIAFENLIAYGENYYKPWPKMFLDIGYDKFIEILIIWSCILISNSPKTTESTHDKLEIMHGKIRGFCKIIWSFLILFFLNISIFMIAVFVCYFTRRDPVNWVGLCLISLIFFERKIEIIFSELEKKSPQARSKTKEDITCTPFP